MLRKHAKLLLYYCGALDKERISGQELKPKINLVVEVKKVCSPKNNLCSSSCFQVERKFENYFT